MYLKCLNIPTKLTFKNGDKIALISSKSGQGRTSFIRSFLGTLSIQSGGMKYGGKIGYSSANNFFINDTIRQNVIFGEPYNEERLKNAYKVSGLSY
jgi:ABC-type transport system involved in cytochrome bd biosynthesis fused ATPase/permease subunit